MIKSRGKSKTALCFLALFLAVCMAVAATACAAVPSASAPPSGNVSGQPSAPDTDGNDANEGDTNGDEQPDQKPAPPDEGESPLPPAEEKQSPLSGAWSGWYIDDTVMIAFDANIDARGCILPDAQCLVQTFGFGFVPQKPYVSLTGQAEKADDTHMVASADGREVLLALHEGAMTATVTVDGYRVQALLRKDAAHSFDTFWRNCVGEYAAAADDCIVTLDIVYTLTEQNEVAYYYAMQVRYENGACAETDGLTIENDTVTALFADGVVVLTFDCVARTFTVAAHSALLPAGTVLNKTF
ncbi:MAG: hypothetical protein HFE46_02620 [Clostridia bacterium]|nr:hypothetical protein [Clostridia bacterium]